MYAAAARRKYPDHASNIAASYCFPLDESNTHGVASYSLDDARDFTATLFAIVDAARRGIFPATPKPQATATRKGELQVLRIQSSLSNPPEKSGTAMLELPKRPTFQLARRQRRHRCC